MSTWRPWWRPWRRPGAESPVPADTWTPRPDQWLLFHHLQGETKIEHAHSMWKARAALAQAESAAALASP
jgi:hypothetical protein